MCLKISSLAFILHPFNVDAVVQFLFFSIFPFLSKIGMVSEQTRKVAKAGEHPER